MPWRETTVFFYLWLALLLFMSLRVLAIESGLAHYPYLNPLEVTYQLTVILFLPPAVAALASLSLPVRGEPLAAFLLGFSTYADKIKRKNTTGNTMIIKVLNSPITSLRSPST
ncbi:MAG: hypothetical protein QI223_04015 [Candidatus Korarchaeota archaeon]|nr:hypothetical protein [Candidatus Korarchaeota archaeon]